MTRATCSASTGTSPRRRDDERTERATDEELAVGRSDTQEEISVIVVRLVCQARFGRAGEVVAGFKQSQAVVRASVAPDVRARLLTDLSGPFDTVVLEVEAASLAEWERLKEEIFSNPQVREAEAGLPDVIDSGRTEFFAVEAEWR
jgi:hypothetical protein